MVPETGRHRVEDRKKRGKQIEQDGDSQTHKEDKRKKRGRKSKTYRERQKRGRK